MASWKEDCARKLGVDVNELVFGTDAPGGERSADIGVSSEPVDGLSRKNFRGIWQWRDIHFPPSLLSSLRKAVSGRLSGRGHVFKHENCEMGGK